MILEENFSLYIGICRVATFFKCTAFELNSASKTLKALKVIPVNGKLIFKLCLSTFFAVVTVSQSYFKRGASSIEETVVSWVGCQILIVGNFYAYLCLHKANDIVLFCNSLFQFHYQHCNSILVKQPSVRIQVSVLFVKCALLSTIMFPITITYGFHWNTSCKSSFLGYWMLNECTSSDNLRTSSNNIINVTLKFGLFLANHWMWGLSLHFLVFVISLILTMSPICLQQFIER